MSGYRLTGCKVECCCQCKLGVECDWMYPPHQADHGHTGVDKCGQDGAEVRPGACRTVDQDEPHKRGSAVVRLGQPAQLRSDL
jgi:hypothetical protein